jgi:hypothetical protein
MSPTRRRFLAFPGLLGILRRCAQSADSWASRKPDEWRPEDIDAVLNRSAWVREVPLAIAGGALANNGKTALGPIEKKGISSAFTAVIRWESALPLRLARRPASLPPEDNGQYVISVAKLPSAFISDVLGGKPGRHPEVLADDGTKAKIAAELLRTASLQRDGKNPLQARQALWAEDDYNPRIMLTIPPGDHPIQPEDQTVTFNAQIGPLLVRASFFLRRMTYQGNLTL